MLKRADTALLSRRGFDTLPMPKGYSPDSVWTVLTALRRRTALTVPMRSWMLPGKPETWCSLNQPINQLLSHIVTEARLHLGRPDLPSLDADRYLYGEFLSKDVSAALSHDGVDLAPQRVRDVLMRGAHPGDQAEQVAENLLDAVFDLGKYARHRVTPWTLDEIASDVGQGCKESRARGSAASGESTGRRDDERVEEICAILGRCSRDVPDSYLIELLNVSACMRDVRPLPRWNGAVELVLRHLALEGMGLPELRIVPLAWSSREWERGGSAKGYPQEDCLVYDPDVGEGFDETRWAYYTLRLVSDALDEIRDTVEETSRSTAEQRHALEADGRLNERQRGVVLQLRENPDLTLRIAAHMRLHGVAYSTARADLLGLVELGFLEQGYQSRAMVFTAAGGAERQTE